MGDASAATPRASITNRDEPDREAEPERNQEPGGDVESRRSRGPLDPRLLAWSPLRRHLVISAVGAVVLAVAVLGLAVGVGWYLPDIVAGSHGAIGPLVGVLVGVGVLRGLATSVTAWSSTRALIGTRAAIRSRLLDHLARLRSDARRSAGPGRVAALLTTGLDALEPWVRAYVPSLMAAAVVPPLAGFVILLIDPWSALIMAIAVPLIPVFMVIIGRATEERTDREWATLQRLAGHFLDVLTGLATLRLFGRADAQVGTVRMVAERYRRAVMRTLRVAFLSAAVLELIATLSVALVAVSLGSRLVSGSIDLEQALIVLMLAPECVLPLRRVGAAFHASTAGLDVADEIDAFLALPTVADGEATLPAIGSLTAAGVVVDDPERGRRLGPADIEVAPGEVVVVRGPNGAGKSTLIDVVRGAITPDAGTVEIGGVAIESLPLEVRRRAIAWVPQHPAPLDESVGASVSLEGTMSSVRSDRDERAEALRPFGLVASMDRRPDTLSGGEAQRLAVARSLLAVRRGGARFVVADEPTAHLDDDATAYVAAELVDAAHQGAGVLVVTHDHRLDLVADTVVTLTGPGRAVEQAASTATSAALANEEDHAGDREPSSPPDMGSRFPTRPDAASLVPEGTPGEVHEPSQTPLDDELSPVQSLRWGLGLARGIRARLVGAQLLGAMAEVCTVGLAAVAAWLVIRASERPLFEVLAVAAVAVRAFGVGKGAFRYAERLASHDAVFRVLSNVRGDVVARLSRLSPSGLPRMPRGELMARVVDDVNRLQDLYLRILGPLAASLIVGLGAVAITFAIDPHCGVILAMALLVAGVVLPFAAAWTSTTTGGALVRGRGNVTAAVVELAEPIDQLVAFGGEPRFRARIEEASATYDGIDARRGRMTATTTGIAAALPALTSAATVSVIGAVFGTVSAPLIGVLVLWPLAVIEMLAPLVLSGELVGTVVAAAGRLRSLMVRPDPVDEPLQPADPGDDSTIALSEVTVRWPESAVAVLRDIDLTVTAGERVVVRGPSGSGKSSLAATLVRFLSPRTGRYSLGGIDADALGGTAVRRRVTWCEQSPWFADASLRTNLAIAAPDADDDVFLAVLGRVGLGDWVAGLPDGLDTQLGRNASLISGGQRQRLALARVLLADHEVVVLDEPTANVDRESAGPLLADLLAVSAERAVIVITHNDELPGDHRDVVVEPRPDGGRLLPADAQVGSSASAASTSSRVTPSTNRTASR